MLLKVNNLNTFYGNLHAIWDINIEVGQCEIVALIGANGAGKSTLLKTIAGSIPAHSGEIFYNDEPFVLHRLKANHLVKKGIVLCPEGRHVFPRMSVEENLKMGGYTRAKEELADSFARVFELFPRLKERVKQYAGTLSGGEQQMLAMGRGLMSQPKLMMLDEPSMGLAPILVEQIFDIIQELNRAGTTILLVEQNAQMALSIANRGYVLETGQIVLHAPASELLSNDAVQKAYLGG